MRISVKFKKLCLLTTPLKSVKLEFLKQTSMLLCCIVIIRLLIDGMENARPNIADVYYKAEKIEDLAKVTAVV